MHTVLLANYDGDAPTATYRVVQRQEDARLVVTEVPDCVSPLEVAISANVCVIPYAPSPLQVRFADLRFGQAVPPPPSA
jgi:hypothetical protein